ncbi:MAG: translation initiation factor IF-1 [Patescibacteria group bacterium]|nr:translation initiation factor IF-1 [Patescibacteria group bacterium]
MPEKKILKEGQVIEALPSTHFRVKLVNGKEILAHLAGRLRVKRIRILPGDKVTVEINPYDENRGRIIYRGK